VKDNYHKIFLTLLHHGTDINIKTKRNQSLLEESLILKMHSISKIIVDYLINHPLKKDTKKYDNYERNKKSIKKIITFIFNDGETNDDDEFQE